MYLRYELIVAVLIKWTIAKLHSVSYSGCYCTSDHMYFNMQKHLGYKLSRFSQATSEGLNWFPRGSIPPHSPGAVRFAWLIFSHLIRNPVFKNSHVLSLWILPCYHWEFLPCYHWEFLPYYHWEFLPCYHWEFLPCYHWEFLPCYYWQFLPFLVVEGKVSKLSLYYSCSLCCFFSDSD